MSDVTPTTALDVAGLAHGLQDVGGADHVDRVDGGRVLVAELHGGEAREVEDDLGAGGGDRGADRRGVRDVAAVAAREAADLGAQRAQPAASASGP